MSKPRTMVINGAKRKSHPMRYPSNINNAPAVDVITSNKINPINHRIFMAFAVFLSILSLFKGQVSTILI